MEENVEKEVISVIANISGFEEDEITLDANMQEELDIDSIKAIEITVALEKKYKISIRDDDIPNIITVRNAVDAVTDLLTSKVQD
ncbi:MAG: phosphopantetheine-binding protein [Thermodesulfovibrionales bacterium]